MFEITLRIFDHDPATFGQSPELQARQCWPSVPAEVENETRQGHRAEANAQHQSVACAGAGDACAGIRKNRRFRLVSFGHSVGRDYVKKI
jgi:hypothetical protein